LTCAQRIIAVESAITKLVIESNYLNNKNDIALAIDACPYAQILGNYIYGSVSADWGIWVSNTYNVNISNNVLLSFLSDGIRLTDSYHCIIDSNIIRNNSAYGIYLYDANCVKNIITSNQIYSNSSGQIQDSGSGNIDANNIKSA
jgi:parallel beta-helix repeat protein